MESYRTVDVIHLHDTNVELSVGDGGIWSEFEFQRWTVDGRSVRKWLEALGFDVPDVIVPRFKDGKKAGNLRRTIEDEAPIQIEATARGKGTATGFDGYEVAWDFTSLEARIVAPNLLDIRYTIGEGETVETFEVTYSGGFTVLWAPAAEE